MSWKADEVYCATDILSTEQDLSKNLYFFQFPKPFPQFSYPPEYVQPISDETVEAAASAAKKAVSFAPETKGKEKDVKPVIDSKVNVKKEPVLPPPEGQIGELVLMKSGKVKLKIGDDILLDVSTPDVCYLLRANTSPSFRLRLELKLPSFNSSLISIRKRKKLRFSAKSIVVLSLRLISIICWKACSRRIVRLRRRLQSKKRRDW